MTDYGREMIDLSSNNPTPDLHALRVAGFPRLGLKATEGTGYGWAGGVTLADAWHRLGGSVDWYHFAHPGDAPAQARFFLAHVKGHTAAGDRLALDLEVEGLSGAFVDAFWTTVHPASPLPEEDYGSPYFLRDHGIRPRHGEGLWLAQYGPAPSFIPPGWTHYDAWQFTDRAHVPGVAGGVDESHLAATPPHPAPHPAPTTPSWYHRLLTAGKPPYLVGPDVRHVQEWLIAHHYLPPLDNRRRSNADGVYGPATASAVKTAESAHHLSADATVGPAVARLVG